jgi:hypothetical protein
MLEYKSLMEQNYVIERSIDDIAEKLLKPAPTEEEENAQDPDKAVDNETPLE